MNWLLLVAIAILAVGAVLGWRAGLVKTVFSLVSTIAVIILTLMLSPLVTGALKSSDTVVSTIYDRIDAVIDLAAFAESEGGTTDPMEFIDGLEFPESVKKVLRNAVEDMLNDQEATEAAEEQMAAVEAYICETITNVILNATGFVVTLIAVAIALAIACFMLNVLSKLPGLSQLNTLAGAAFGALEGLVIIWILFVIITMFGSTEFGHMLMNMIGESKVLSFLYDINFIAKFVTSL